jgi:hypothetical protein
MMEQSSAQHQANDMSNLGGGLRPKFHSSAPHLSAWTRWDKVAYAMLASSGITVVIAPVNGGA